MTKYQQFQGEKHFPSQDTVSASTTEYIFCLCKLTDNIVKKKDQGFGLPLAPPRGFSLSVSIILIPSLHCNHVALFHLSAYTMCAKTYIHDIININKTKNTKINSKQN